MSQENSFQDMRSEYDIRGGVRGKYFTQYVQAMKSMESRLVIHTTTSAPQIGVVTRPLSYLAPIPSPMLQIGGSSTTRYAGSNSPRR